MGALTNLDLISLKEFKCSPPKSNLEFFRIKANKDLARSAKDGIKRRKYEAKPKNLCNFFGVLGSGKSFTAYTFCGFGKMPS